MKTELMAYLADYINEELARGAPIDKYTIAEAVLSFEGGAADLEELADLENTK